VLGPEELARRIRAARELRGIEQTELGLLLAKDGLGKHDAGRIERGVMTMQTVHRISMSRHLRVPEEWFTEPDVDIIVGLRPSGLPTEADAALLEQVLRAAVQALRQEQEPETRDTGGPDHPAPEAGADDE
jgi:hypothetical protein